MNTNPLSSQKTIFPDSQAAIQGQTQAQDQAQGGQVDLTECQGQSFATRTVKPLPSEKKYFTKTELLGRFWTLSMIKKYLPVPDSRRNNIFNGSAPVCLYDKGKVLYLEQEAEIRGRIKRTQCNRQKRSESAKQAAETRKKLLIEKIERLDISVPSISQEDLKRYAVDHYNKHQLKIGTAKKASCSDSAAFLNRLSLNYLRHCCTIYDEELRTLHGLSGRDSASARLRQKINNKIIEQYPYLKDSNT